MTDSTKLFGDRVKEYVKFRPGYPVEIVTLLADKCGLTPQWRIADIGSGPGNLTRIFLQNGNSVIGVEPNLEMRQAAERLLGSERLFRSVDGTAEATTLESGSVELMVAGQAFHWFDPIQARVECRRILVPTGWAALIWNERKHDASRFMEGYERIFRDLIPDYRLGKARGHGQENILAFYGGTQPERAEFQQFVEHGWESLSGLALSTSYVPKMDLPFMCNVM